MDKDTKDNQTHKGDRIAKVIARAGLCSRRDAERWINDGRVTVNGEKLRTPAFLVSSDDEVIVDGKKLVTQQNARPRLFMYHKPAGVLTTNKDPQGRPTIFDKLPSELPRVVTVGRLDMNTEGLLLLSTDGALARYMELPKNELKREYRVRAYGKTTQEKLDRLKKGITYGGVRYGSINATLEKQQGDNAWITMSLAEGKNREVRYVLEALGLRVNRLIRTSYAGLFLGKIPPKAILEVKYGEMKKLMPDFFQS